MIDAGLLLAFLATPGLQPETPTIVRGKPRRHRSGGLRALAAIAVFAFVLTGLIVGYSRAPSVIPGSQTFNSSGTFVVPAYNSITFTIWGAGGGGGFPGHGATANICSGQSTGLSSSAIIAGVTRTAFGGNNGSGLNQTAGTGGAASGGTTNTTGNTGTNGGPAGSGGNGAAAPGSPSGAARGGDGSPLGSFPRGGGGGSAGRVIVTLSAGALVVGSSISLAVAAALASCDGGAAVGEPGRITVDWN